MAGNERMKMMSRFLRSALPALALAVLLLAGCQTDKPDPPSTRTRQVAPVDAEPTEQVGAESQAESVGPATASPATATASPAMELDDQAESADDTTGDNEPDAEDSETPEAETPGVASGQANADVEFVRTTLAADGSWRFDVTVRHPDTGWEDYADGWDVVTLDGLVLKARPDDPFTRLLLHPHENEQPFTRSQSGLELPEGVTVVIVRAHDLVDGFGGRELRVDLTGEGGTDFEVIRE
jgi:hypothetical protein